MYKFISCSDAFKSEISYSKAWISVCSSYVLAKMYPLFSFSSIDQIVR